MALCEGAIGGGGGDGEAVLRVGEALREIFHDRRDAPIDVARNFRRCLRDRRGRGGSGLSVLHIHPRSVRGLRLRVAFGLCKSVTVSGVRVEWFASCDGKSCAGSVIKLPHRCVVIIASITKLFLSGGDLLLGAAKLLDHFKLTICFNHPLSAKRMILRVFFVGHLRSLGWVAFQIRCWRDLHFVEFASEFFPDVRRAGFRGLRIRRDRLRCCGRGRLRLGFR